MAWLRVVQFSCPHLVGLAHGQLRHVNGAPQQQVLVRVQLAHRGVVVVPGTERGAVPMHRQLLLCGRGELGGPHARD
jgi:hypothetical protein